MNLQVKSWANAQAHPDGCFHYPLEVPAFNHLAGTGHDVRHYLVLVAVPATASKYAHANHRHLLLRHAAYWLSLRNETPDPTLNINSTKTVLVPEKQLLTPSTLRDLMAGREAQAVVP